VRVLLFVISLLLLSCHSKEDHFESYVDFESYVNDPDNGFIQKQETADFIFEAKLTPPIEGEENTECTLQLRINRKDGGSVLDFGGVAKPEALERENYLSFELTKDVYLDESGHTNPAIFHHYERNYGLKPSIDLLFHFMNVNPEDDIYFVYRDQLFEQGLVRIKLDKELFTKCYVKNA